MAGKSRVLQELSQIVAFVWIESLFLLHSNILLYDVWHNHNNYLWLPKAKITPIEPPNPTQVNVINHTKEFFNDSQILSKESCVINIQKSRSNGQNERVNSPPPKNAKNKIYQGDVLGCGYSASSVRVNRFNSAFFTAICAYVLSVCGTFLLSGVRPPGEIYRI